jgi:uncharacterized protein (DUF4415 family)
MTGSSSDTVTPFLDPDDAPELDDAFFADAELSVDGQVRREARSTWRGRGRPKSVNPKIAVNLRLDAAVLAHFRAGGPGWQSRINQTLRRAAGIQDQEDAGLQ